MACNEVVTPKTGSPLLQTLLTPLPQSWGFHPFSPPPFHSPEVLNFKNFIPQLGITEMKM